MQYNYARASYGTLAPEDATFQDTGYLVCGSYTYSTYVEAFGCLNDTDNKTSGIAQYVFKTPEVTENKTFKVATNNNISEGTRKGYEFLKGHEKSRRTDIKFPQLLVDAIRKDLKKSITASSKISC